MKSMLKMNQKGLIIALILIFGTMTLGLASAEVMKIKPKDNKQIKIGVMDANAALEIAAYFNKEHRAAAEARGWKIEFFDLKDNFTESVSCMENMISAGYDAVIIHWVPTKMFDVMIKKAFEKGIPVITISTSSPIPWVVAEFGQLEAAGAAISAEYLALKLKPGDKILTYNIKAIENMMRRGASAKAIFDWYKIIVAQDLYYPLTGDPMQHSYETVKNALLGDTKKEIKGLFTPWDGFAISAARAALDLGRKDFIVTADDDSPNSYSQMGKLPTYHATVGIFGDLKQINQDLYGLLDKVFKGESVETQQNHAYLPRLVTRDKLPPKGYFYSYCGYEGRPPDFEAK